jgi:endonuclease/exonuclease/phosphatase family metal-dependent hydrolase
MTGSTTDVKFMTYNIAGGIGTNNVSNWHKQAELIHAQGAAVVCLNESTNVGPAIRDRLKMLSGVTWYSASYGTNTFLAKYPITSSAIALTDYECAPRSLLRGTMTISGKTVHAFCTHLDTNFGSCTRCTPQTRVDEITQVKSHIAMYTGDKVLLGDINTEPHGTEANPTEEWLTLTAPPNGAFVDTWDQARRISAATAYPPCNPVTFNVLTRGEWRLDYIFSLGPTVLSSKVPDTRDLTNTNVVNTVGTCDDAGVRPSDHNPVITTLRLR